MLITISVFSILLGI